jgi:CRISPR-associated endonuclease/helicase Cas3
MAHLLKTAHQRGLRRIFVVLPFTNIIDQSVDVYRRALVLHGEDPERIVAAHHHRVEFDGPDLRQLTHRWDCPIIVTTAVQFFETLAACKTSRLRKLHQLPGSGIFIDEAHAAIPAALWPQMFRWLTALCHDWKCHLVLGSGSLVRFWQLADFVPPPERPAVAELVPEDLRGERQRWKPDALNWIRSATFDWIH